MSSLREEFEQSDDENPHDYSSHRQTTDIAVNLSEFERPVGGLKFDISDILVGGKSLNELEESARRSRDIPTTFHVGSEVFDINNRRYLIDDSLNPQAAARDVAVVFKSILGNEKIRGRLNSAFEKYSHTSPEAQVLGTMIIGIANIFYAGAGLQMRLNHQTLNIPQTIALNSNIAAGKIDAAQHPSFEQLKRTAELDAVSSMAIDLFVGRANGVEGVNGIVASQLELLGEHITSMMAIYLDSIDDALGIDALMSILQDEKWKDDSIGLSVYLSEVDFHGNLARLRSALTTRTGGLSIELINAFVNLSLYGIDDDNGAFTNGRIRPFMITSMEVYNNVFSRYIITLAATISGDYPLANTTRTTTMKSLIEYQNMRIKYEAAIVGTVPSDSYIKSRIDSRVLHSTIYKFWRMDTAHTRLLRHAAGKWGSRYEGSIKVILSATENTLNDVVLEGTSIDLSDIYESTNDSPIEINHATVQKEQPMSNSFIAISPNATEITTITSGALFDNTGKTIEMVSISSTKSLVTVGMASFIADRSTGDTVLTEASSNKVIGEVKDNTFVFDTTALGRYYNALLQMTPASSELTPCNSVLLINNESYGSPMHTTAVSGSLPFEIKSVLQQAIDEAIRLSAPNKMNNVWASSALELKIVPTSATIVVEGEEIGIAGTDEGVYPARYYTSEQGPLNWIKMVNSANNVYECTDDIDLAPAAIIHICRSLTREQSRALDVKVIQIGNLEMIVIDSKVLPLINGSTPITNITEACKFSGGVALFTYIDANNSVKFYAAEIKMPTPKKVLPVEEEVVPTTNGGELFKDDHGAQAVVAEVAPVADAPSAREEFLAGAGSIDPLANTNTDARIVNTAREHRYTSDSVADLGDIIQLGESDVEEAVETEVVDAMDIVNGTATEVETEEEEYETPKSLNDIMGDFSTLSLYGTTHYADFETVEEAIANPPETETLEHTKVVSLNRYKTDEDGSPVTYDESILTFAEEYCSSLNHQVVTHESNVGLLFDTDGDDRNAIIELFASLGASTYTDVDTIADVDHKWLLKTRWNEFAQGFMIHIIDIYDTTEVVVDKDREIKVYENDAIVRVEDILDIADTLTMNQIPALIEGVEIAPAIIANVDDATRACILNVDRRVTAEMEGVDREDKLRIVELIREAAEDDSIPRRLRRVVSKDLLNRAMDTITKYHVGAFEASRITNVNTLGHVISNAFDLIGKEVGGGKAEAFIEEINNLPLLDLELIDVVVIDDDMERLAIGGPVSYATTTSLPMNLDDLNTTRDVYVLTADEQLLRYNREGLFRNNISLTHRNV